MLSYMEGTTIYNAANFTIDPFSSPISPSVNGTAVYTKITSFLCPSDGNAGSRWCRRARERGRAALINSYYASVGTTTYTENAFTNGTTLATCPGPANPGQPTNQGSTGVFWYSRSYGIQYDHRRHVEHRGFQRGAHRHQRHHQTKLHHRRQREWAVGLSMTSSRRSRRRSDGTGARHGRVAEHLQRELRQRPPPRA